MRIHRAKLFARAWPASGCPRWPAKVPDPRGHVALVGIAEADGAIVEHRVHGFMLLDACGTKFAMTGQTHDPEVPVACDIEGLLTNDQWPAPRDTAASGGGVTLRRTRIVGEHAPVWIMIACMAAAPGWIEDQTMIEISGDLDGILDIDRTSDATTMETNGTTLSQLLKQPIWGWDEEPWGLVSTMELTAIDACMRLEDLRDRNDPADADEIERLVRGPSGWAVESGKNDPQYQEYKRRYVAEAGRLRWDARIGLSEQRRRSKIASRIIREIRSAD